MTVAKSTELNAYGSPVGVLLLAVKEESYSGE